MKTLKKGRKWRERGEGDAHCSRRELLRTGDEGLVWTEGNEKENGERETLLIGKVTEKGEKEKNK